MGHVEFDADALRKELALSKAARDEWMGRWRSSEMRMSAVWNDAIFTAASRLGHHAPPCLGECFKCWFYDVLQSLYRGDIGNYVPVKERLRADVKSLKSRCTLPPKERKAYIRGLDDIMLSVEKMLSDHE